MRISVSIMHASTVHEGSFRTLYNAQNKLFNMHDNEWGKLYNTVDTHCYVVQYRQIDREQRCSKIYQQLIAECFGHVGLRHMHTKLSGIPTFVAHHAGHAWLTDIGLPHAHSR